MCDVCFCCVIPVTFKFCLTFVYFQLYLTLSLPDPIREGTLSGWIVDVFSFVISHNNNTNTFQALEVTSPRHGFDLTARASCSNCEPYRVTNVTLLNIAFSFGTTGLPHRARIGKHLNAIWNLWDDKLKLRAYLIALLKCYVGLCGGLLLFRSPPEIVLDQMYFCVWRRIGGKGRAKYFLWFLLDELRWMTQSEYSKCV